MDIGFSNGRVWRLLMGILFFGGVGISQVVPYPYQGSLRAVREFHRLMKQYAPTAEGSRFVEVTVISSAGKLLK